jgi:hypothetical protein
MKKLIGVIAILLTLILSVIYRQLTHHSAKAKPDTCYVPRALQDGMFLTALLIQ